MERLGFDLDDGSSPTDGRPQSNPQEACKQSIQRCIQSVVHACQCRDANCLLPSCQKMNRVVTHTKNCKRKTHGGCPICKQLIALCCYHAKHCKENKCLVPFCPNIKQKLRQQNLPQRLQEQQFNPRRAAAMNIRMQAMSQSTAPVPAQVTAGGSKEEMSPGSISPAQGMAGMGSPHHTGIGMKPGTQKPPAAVLQIVKQVQAEAARQQTHVGYGKLGPTTGMHPPGMRMANHMNPNVSKPQHAVGGAGINVGPGAAGNMMGDWNSGPRFNQANNPNAMRSPNPNQMMQPNQMQGNQQMMQQMPGNSQMIQSMSQNVTPNMIQPGGTTSNTQQKQTVQQLLQTLKNNLKPEQQQQLLQLLKENLQLTAVFIKLKQRQQNQNQQQQQNTNQDKILGDINHAQQQKDDGSIITNANNQSEPNVSNPNEMNRPQLKSMNVVAMGNIVDCQSGPVKKDWHQEDFHKIRHKLMSNIVHSHTMSCPWEITDFVNSITIFEKATFEKANSRIEYLGLMTEKLFEIQENFQNKKSSEGPKNLCEECQMASTSQQTQESENKDIMSNASASSEPGLIPEPDGVKIKTEIVEMDVDDTSDINLGTSSILFDSWKYTLDKMKEENMTE